MPRSYVYSDTFGGRLAQRRDALRLSQTELARQVGASRRSVANWEADSHMPHRMFMEPIARALGVTVAWLVDGDDQRIAASGWFSQTVLAA